VSPPHDDVLANRLASDLGSQALSSSHVSVEQRCLTPDITGPPNGLTSNHVNGARRLRCMSLLDIPQSSLLPLDYACCATTALPRLLKHCREALARRTSTPAHTPASVPTTPQQGKLEHAPASGAGKDYEGCARMASEFGSQALSNNLVSVEQRCLTLTFSGATNGTERNHANGAAWPPLQRVVRLCAGHRRFGRYAVSSELPLSWLSPLLYLVHCTPY
jgi:hypothetical protein